MNRFKRARRDKVPHYFQKVLDELHKAPVPPHAGILAVKHDDCCAHWRGRACNCEPIVKLRAVRKLDGMDAP